jgi:hypothetical protein
MLDPNRLLPARYADARQAVQSALRPAALPAICIAEWS